MKKTVLLLLLLCGAFAFSGCSIIFEEPSALILPPASDQNEYVERTLINSFLSDGEHLQVPEEMDAPAAFINLDVDGDGQNEKMAFWSNSNGHEVGVLLMQRGGDGTWGILDQIRQYGAGIDYFKLIDLDGDGKEEACVGIDVGGNNVLSIYRLSADGFAEMAQLNYSLLDIIDLNGDGSSAVLCALNDYDDTAPTTTLTVYEGGTQFQNVYEKSFDGNGLEMAFGNVSADQKGLYFVRTSNYSDLNVELLLPTADNGFEEQMTGLVHYVNAVSSRNGSDIVADITGDGVLDVQSVVEPIETTTGRDEGDYLRIWKTWDGETGLTNVYGVMENNTDGYTFILPQYCLDTVRYQFVNDKGSSQVRLYDGNNTEPAIILYAQTASEVQNIENTPGIISLGTSPSSQRAYYALCNTESFAGQKINPDDFTQLFQIEGGQQNDE